jgi:hypothetical protein
LGVGFGVELQRIKNGGENGKQFFFVGTSENLYLKALEKPFLFWANKIFHQKTLQ